MDVVVVGHVGMVMILQSHHEGNESVRWDLKGLQQVTLLQQQERMNTSDAGSVKVKLNHLLKCLCDVIVSFIHLLSYKRTILCLRKYSCFTWKMVYMVTVRGRFPEY